MMDTDNLDFSFSGLKTAVITYLKKHPLDGPDVDRRTADMVAAFQEAVVDVLVSKSLRAAEMNRTDPWYWPEALPPTAASDKKSRSARGKPEFDCSCPRRNCARTTPPE